MVFLVNYNILNAYFAVKKNTKNILINNNNKLYRTPTITVSEKTYDRFCLYKELSARNSCEKPLLGWNQAGFNTTALKQSFVSRNKNRLKNKNNKCIDIFMYLLYCLLVECIRYNFFIFNIVSMFDWYVFILM